MNDYPRGFAPMLLGVFAATWLSGLLHSPDRVGDIPVMPAAGLVLEEVGYPPDDQLAARAQAARAVRTLGEECP